MHAAIARRLRALEQLQQSAGSALDLAAGRLVESLAAGGRIMIAHDRAAAGTARAMSQRMVQVYESERPPLPVCVLGTGGDDDGASERHLQAIANPGDCLIACLGGSDSRSLAGVLDAAHAQHLYSIVLDNPAARPDPSELWDSDVELCAADDHPALVQEQQLVLAHCICEAIDQQLFGA